MSTNQMEDKTVRCEELYHLLRIYQQEKDWDIAYQLITTHILSCAKCARGLSKLTQELLSFDTLSCEQCRSRLPSYYETIHPDHPQVSLPDVTIAAVALHMGHCRNCSQLYSALVQVSEIEERGEFDSVVEG